MKIAVLAGGHDQITFINRLKALGHEIYLIDYFLNPPAKPFADYHIQCSTLDIMDVHYHVKKEQIEFLTTCCTDQALLTVAIVSEMLSLPCYITAELAKQVTDKTWMKSIMKQNNVKSADFFALSEADIFEEKYVANLSYPVIVKPCDCNSSKGVIKVTSDQELETSLQAALLLSRSKQVIVEKFISGIEISIDAWVENGTSIILSISKTSKLETNTSDFTIFRSSYPVSGLDPYLDEITQTVQHIATSFHLVNSPLLVQGILSDEGFFVIEFSARMGGGTKYKLIQLASGVDIMDSYIDLILTQDSKAINPSPSKYYYEFNYLYVNPGVVTELTNFNECIESGYMEDFYCYKNIGAKIETHKTSSDRVVGIVIKGDSDQNILEKRLAIQKIIDIKDHEKSILLQECFSGEV